MVKIKLFTQKQTPTLGSESGSNEIDYDIIVFDLIAKLSAHWEKPSEEHFDQHFIDMSVHNDTN